MYSSKVKDKTYMYECRCDERLNTKVEESTRLANRVARGTGTPKSDTFVYLYLRRVEKMFFYFRKRGKREVKKK